MTDWFISWPSPVSPEGDRPSAGGALGPEHRAAGDGDDPPFLRELGRGAEGPSW